MSIPAFNYKTTGDEVVAHFKEDAKGLTVLITGVAHTGIGGATAVSLARGGARTLILAARSEARAAETIAAVKRANPAVHVVFLQLDLASLKSVRAAAQTVLDNATVPVLDVLVNNAGVSYVGKTPRMTADGLEETFAVCHVGHWLLTSLLMPKLRAAPAPRVVNLSSAGHNWWDGTFTDHSFARTPFDGLVAYGQAKAGNIVFSKGLAQKFGPGLKSYSVNPGWVTTELARGWTPEDFQAAVAAGKEAGLEYSSEPKTVEQGCATTLVAVLDPAIPNGAYLDDCHVKKPNAKVEDPRLVDELWEVSEKIVGAKFL